MEKDYTNTVLYSFTLADFSKEHRDNHFDYEKTSKDFKTCVSKLVQMIQPVMYSQCKVSATCHSTGCESGSSHYPASVVRVLIDVMSHHEIVRTYALFQAYANYFQSHLTAFDYQLKKFDPNARYRLELQW